MKTCRACHTAKPLDAFHKDSNGHKLVVDHDHSCCPAGGSCGKCVRGLLCHSCNRAIGLMRDDTERIRRAAAYIEGARK